MTTAEKIELALIPAGGGTVWLVAPGLLPGYPSVGVLLLGASGLILFQGLLRDLWLLSKARRAARLEQHPRRQTRCLCVESTVGVSGVVAGLVALGLGVPGSLAIDRWGWSLLVTGVLILGFSFKDHVVGWRPWRLRREKDHASLVFTWKH